MKKLFSIIALSLLTSYFLLLTSNVFAQTPVSPTPVDYTLPYPGVLPDHPLYPLKRVRDNLLYFFARSSVNKIEISLLFADKKIGMAKNLLEKNKDKLALETVIESQSDLLKAAKLVPELNKKNILPVGLTDKISLAAKKHLEEISKMGGFGNLNESEKLNQARRLNNQANSLIDSIKE